MKKQITPTEKMATAYFKAGVRGGSIRKVGDDQYFEDPETAPDEDEPKGYDPMELCE
jgi:hypothetical protein